MKKTTRVQASRVNALYGVVFQAITLIMSFIVRSIFIRHLGNEYLGLDSLFKNLLNLLSFTELGIGVAISSSLYEPLANNDIPLINSLIDLLRKFYYVIISIILIAGITMTFFLPHFINGEMPDGAKIAFSLYFINSAATYMLVVNRTLLIADQKGYINSINQFIFLLFQQILQIFFLIKGMDYIIFLCIQLFFTIFSNLSLRYRSMKLYPFLREKQTKKVPKIVAKRLKENVIGMISAKFGGIILTSSDNLVLSMFVSLAAVGNYTNYTTVVNGLTTIMNSGISAITASIGNLGTEQDTIKEKKTFFQLYWSNAVLIMNLCFGAYFFFDDFINLWVGSKFILSEMTTVAIVFLFFQNQLRQISIAFQIAHSLFWQQRYKSIVEAISNLIFSLIFVRIFNLSILGVVLGTILSNLFVNTWWEPLIVFRYGLKTSMKKYWISLACVHFIFITCLIVIHILKNIIMNNSPVNLIFEYLIFSLIFNIIMWFLVPDFRNLMKRAINK